MKTKAWLKAAAVRAIRTMAQTFIATIGSSTVLATVDFRVVVSSTILAGIISVVTSLAGLPEVDKETK
jgi:hypothetical protein